MSTLMRHRAQQRAVPLDGPLNAQIADAEHGGIAAVARIQAGAFATSVAVQNACMLAQATNAAFQVSPAGEEIYRSILMAYGTLAASEIQGLSFTRGRGRL